MSFGSGAFSEAPFGAIPSAAPAPQVTTYSRVTPTGWQQYTDSTTFSRVSPTGWDQITVAAAPSFKSYWTVFSNQLIGFVMKKNVSGQVVGVQMISASDGSAFTGAVTAYITKDGGVQAIGSGSPAGQCVHEGNGFHTYAPTQSETNADHIAFTFTATGAIASTVQVYTTFPQTGDNFARLGAPAGASVSADIAAVKTQTAAIETDTQDIQTRLPTALVSGRIDASVGAIASGVDLTATMKASVNTEVDTALSDVGLTSTVTGRIDATVSSRATQTSVDTLTGYVDTEVAAIKAKTDNLPASPAATGDIPSASTVATAVRSELTTELGRLDATVSSRATQTSVDTIDDLLDTEVAAIKAKTDLIPASPAAVSDIPSAASVATAVRSELGTELGRIDATISSRATQTSVDTVDDFLDTEIAAIKAKTDLIPAAPAAVSDIPTASTIADAVWDEATSGHTTAGTYGGRIIRSGNSNVEVLVTGSSHIAADVHEFQADVLTSAAIAADAITAAALASDVATEIAAGVWNATIASHVNAGSTGLALRDADLRGSRTVIRGTVGTGTTPSTTQFTPSSITPAGAAADQFKGRIIIFDNDTATAALRGQATDITANSNASTPLFTFTALTTAPASGDTFSIV